MRLLLACKPKFIIRVIGAEDYRAHCGLLAGPSLAAWPHEAAAAGVPWAADNDCFRGLNRDAFVKLLKNVAHQPNCLFVVAPDVVADADGTLCRFHQWKGAIRHFGLPVALALQNGAERQALPWDELDAVFIGGDTKWKLGAVAARLASEAKARGKWVHMGRANTQRRIQYAQAIGCDSSDGSGLVRFSRDMLPGALKTVREPMRPLWPGLLLPDYT